MTKNDVYNRLSLLLGGFLEPDSYLDFYFEKACRAAGIDTIESFEYADPERKEVAVDFFFRLHGFTEVSQESADTIDMTRVGNYFKEKRSTGR